MYGNYYPMGNYSAPYYPAAGAMPDNLAQLRNQQPMAQLPMQQPQAQENGLNWVQGIEGAKSWYVPPGKNALLMDSEAQMFYIKTVDASGMPAPLRVFQYSEVTQPTTPPPATAPANLSDFVTRKELEQILANLKIGGINNAEPVVSNVE